MNDKRDIIVIGVGTVGKSLINVNLANEIINKKIEEGCCVVVEKSIEQSKEEHIMKITNTDRESLATLKEDLLQNRKPIDAIINNKKKFNKK